MYTHTAKRSGLKHRKAVRSSNTPVAGIDHNQPPVDPLEGRLTVRPDEAWRMLGIGHSKGFAMIARGDLTVTRLGGVTLIHADSIRAMLAKSSISDRAKAAVASVRARKQTRQEREGAAGVMP